ncbi:TPA: hypothetical protein HA363_03475 [Candidatus Woesearchaeota archaeon]|nr:hypothetical protein [Candidatus Woesearchaeota archaeon]
MKSIIAPREKKRYEQIIEEATMDCHDEDEQISGWACLLDDWIHTPCNCTIGKEMAVLEKVDTDDTGNAIIGVIKLNKTKLRVLIQDIVLDNPEAMTYINAYRYWCKNGS